MLGGEVAQRLLECYPVFMEVEPDRLGRLFPAMSLAACQDVAQEAFLRVGVKAEAGELPPETNVMAYLRTAARNLALDWCREQQRRHKRLVVMGGDALDAVPETRELADEDRVVLEELVIPAIAEMPESRRRQVVNLQSQGMDDGQIAEELGIPVTRLHKLRHMAVVHLRGRLAGHIRDGHQKNAKHGKKDR